jgi:hypothetical protein
VRTPEEKEMFQKHHHEFNGDTLQTEADNDSNVRFTDFVGWCWNGIIDEEVVKGARLNPDQISS